jgi:UDP-2,3-diacylglucosamine pyrophosphatase LpxH
LEETFHRFGVDMVIVGHNHHYERTHPVYNKKPEGKLSIGSIRNPKAAIYVVNGSAVIVFFFFFYVTKATLD